MSNPASTRPGFTLIELLIVVVIIGIIAAIALPKMSASRNEAYKATMKSDLKLIHAALLEFASANSGRFPTDAEGGVILSELELSGGIEKADIDDRDTSHYWWVMHEDSEGFCDMMTIDHVRLGVDFVPAHTPYCTDFRTTAPGRY